ncbi:hypothetical protein TOTORO_03240 [Serratia phage vB_SmaS-Totoro]|nr:hypothetical protein TOTORO_03240 [Serratia phage vB_SmaS-Totoro]
MFEVNCDSVADNLFSVTLSKPSDGKFNSNYSRKVSFRIDSKVYSIRLASISAVHQFGRNCGEGVITIITQSTKYTFKYRKGAVEAIDEFMAAWEQI